MTYFNLIYFEECFVILVDSVRKRVILKKEGVFGKKKVLLREAIF